MNKNSRIPTILLVLLLIAACKEKTVVVEKVIVPNEERKSLEDGTTNSNKIPNKPKSSLDYKITFRRVSELNEETLEDESFVKNLNKYNVTFESARNLSENSGFYCLDKLNEANVVKYEAKILDRNHASKEMNFSNSRTNAHQLKCYLIEDGKIVDESISEQKIYLDYFVHGTVYPKDIDLLLNSDNQVGTIVFDEDSILVTRGMDLKISAEAVVGLKNSQIITFFENEVYADNDQDGKNGGVIQINTKKIAGELLIKMHGQNAGKVTKVPPKKVDYPAAYLADPNKLDGHYPRSQAVTVCDDRGYKPRCDIEFQVQEDATNGSDGLVGDTGDTGYQGKNGGDAGYFKVNTEEEVGQFNLNAVIKFGSKGAGGKGGQGGPGTPGGKHHCYNFEIPYYCDSFHDGIVGKDGPTGKDGPDGFDGKIPHVSSFYNNSNNLHNKDF